MTTPLDTLRALYHVYNGDTYDYAIKANEAFDERARTANALANLLTDRVALSEAPTDKDTKYSARMSQIALEAARNGTAHESFVFNVSMAAAVTPSREQLGDKYVSPVEVNAQAPAYSGPLGL